MAIPGVAFRRGVLWRALGFSLALGGPLISLAGILYWIDLGFERKIQEQDARSVVDLAFENTHREFEGARSDLLLLAAGAYPLSAADRDALSSSDLRRQFETFLKLKRVYDSVRVLDLGGDELLVVNYGQGRPVVAAAGDLRSGVDAETLRRLEALQPGEIDVSRLRLGTRSGSIERPLKPVVRLLAPVFDEGGVRRGAIGLDMLGQRVLRGLDDASAGFGGAMLLLSEEGYYLRGARESDNWGLDLGHGHTFADDHPDAWRQIEGRYRGHFVTPDGMFSYRLHRAAGAVGGGLLIVARIPQDRLLERTERWRFRGTVAVLAGVPMLLALGWYLASAIEQRSESSARLARSEQQLRRLSRELLDAQERERAALSRDLHDDLGQLVTLIALDLERAHSADPAVSSRAVMQARAGTRRVLERLHEIASSLRPRLLDELGLREASRSLMTEFEERTGIEIHSRIDLGGCELSPAVAENAFRILQEALTNAYKHARTRSVDVALECAEGLLRMRIVDRGIGFDTEEAADGLGLLGIRERVENLGGTYAVRSRPGRGTEMEVRLPAEPETRRMLDE